MCDCDRMKGNGTSLSIPPSPSAMAHVPVFISCPGQIVHSNPSSKLNKPSRFGDERISSADFSSPTPPKAHQQDSMDSDSKLDSQKALSSAPQVVTPSAPEATRRDLKFWMSMVCITIASFIVALDLVSTCMLFYNVIRILITSRHQTGLTTALPIIVQDLGGEQFEWVGSAYALSATAFLPLSGALAQVRYFPPPGFPLYFFS